LKALLPGACVAVVAIGLSVPAIVSSRGQMTERQPRRVLASETNTHVADAARRAEQTDDTGFLGVVVALQSVELSAKFDGTLERLDVHVGDHVKGGALIARLDSRSVAQDLAIAEASLRVAEAEHDRLVIELKDASNRRARLHSIPELFAREQLEAADSQEAVAAARLRGSVAELAGKRARTNQLREMFRDAHIVAPFDGTVAARYVDPGTTVSRSTPIVRVISPTSLVIRFAVPEEQAAGAAVGRNVIVRVGSVNLTADGVIESVVPEIDAALRMVVIEARLTTNGGRTQTIPAGAIARVRVATDPNHLEHDAVIVRPPNSAPGGSTGHERPIN
jgi:RND family efflux transporter MFP subunit